MAIPKHTLTLRVYRPGDTVLLNGVWEFRLLTVDGIAVDDNGDGMAGIEPVPTSAGVAVVQLPDTTHTGYDPLNAYYEGTFRSVPPGLSITSQPFHMDTDKSFDDIMVPTTLPVTPSLIAVETVRAEAAESALRTDLTTEVARATSAEALQVSMISATGPGIDPIGATDSAAAIQAKLDAAMSFGVGAVWLPKGTYLLSAALRLYAHVRLIGEGSDATVLQLANGANCSVVETNGYATLSGTNKWYVSEGVPVGFGLEHCRVDGNKAHNTAGAGVRFYGKRYRLVDVLVHDCYGDGVKTECGAQVGQTETDDLPEGEVDRVWSRNNGGHGFYHRGVHDCHYGSIYPVLNGGDGFHSESVGGSFGGSCDIDFVHSYGNTGNGVYLGATASILNLISESNGLQGLVMAAGIVRPRVSTAFVYNNCTASQANPHVELLSVSNATFGSLTIRGDNGGTAFRNDSGSFYTDIGCLNIDGRSTAGIGLDVAGNNLTIAAATILNYSAGGGIGVRVGSGVSQVDLNVTTLNNDTHVSYLGSPARSRFNFNGFVSAGQTDVTGTLPSATSLCWYRHAFGGPGATGANSNNLLAGASWNTGHMLLGGNHLWVDATGALRIKSSAPASDTDGNSVFSSTVLTAEWTTAQTNTVYNIPVGATALVIETEGGGPGGGSGRRGAASTVRCGGGGGAGAPRSRIEVAVADLGVTSLYVTVGAGGVGGAAVTTDDTDGNPGAVGGVSAVRTTGTNTAASTLTTANTGAVGSGGTNSSGAGGSSSNLGTFGAVAGASAGVSGGPGVAAGASAGAAGSGGSGGGVNISNTTSAGGSGGVAGGGYLTAPTGGTAGGGAGDNGSNNAVLSPGQGGAGGGSNTTGAGGAGGNGGRGAGGGGGGASLNGNASGKGGDGGDGYVKITALF